MDYKQLEIDHKKLEADLKIKKAQYVDLNTELRRVKLIKIKFETEIEVLRKTALNQQEINKGIAEKGKVLISKNKESINDLNKKITELAKQQEDTNETIKISIRKDIDLIKQKEADTKSKVSFAGEKAEFKKNQANLDIRIAKQAEDQKKLTSQLIEIDKLKDSTVKELAKIDQLKAGANEILESAERKESIAKDRIKHADMMMGKSTAYNNEVNSRNSLLDTKEKDIEQKEGRLKLDRKTLDRDQQAHQRNVEDHKKYQRETQILELRVRKLIKDKKIDMELKELQSEFK